MIPGPSTQLSGIIDTAKPGIDTKSIELFAIQQAAGPNGHSKADKLGPA